MKIKELIIDGFKSYQKQVILTEFDSQFNCLTGQNGTGKSNILEAIFFAIGFNFRNSKLSRVSNPRDLIYKRGQSGVQKAKVIVKFCNRDKTKSPVGYEDKDDLILERSISSIDNKGKFKFNSVTKKPSQIKAIFKSIRLNVDNSNTFFVQQGKVAEIVKFHPLELMKFVEESAGVSYFNSVKQETERNMELNEPKLQACIDGVQKLENDQMQNEEQIKVLKKYNMIEQQLKKLQSQEEYYKKKQGKEDMIRNDKDIKRLQEEENQLKQQIETTKKLLEQKSKEIETFELEEKVQVDNNLKIQQDNLKNELNDVQVKVDELQIIIDNLKDKQQKSKLDNKNKKVQKEKKKALLDTLEEQYHNLKIELQKNKLEKKDLLQHIKEGQSKKKQTEFLRSKFEQAKQEYLKMQQNMNNEQDRKVTLTNKLQKLENQLVQNNNQYQKFIKQHERYLEQQNKLDIEYDEIQVQRKQITEIKQQRTYQENQLGQIDRKMQEQLGRLQGLLEVSNYQQVKERFDNKQFFKKVHNIIRVKDPNKFNTALETIAGKKLFQYVVSDENVSTQLMESDILKGNIQIIPNNKIQGSSIQIEKLTLAKQIAQQMNQEVWSPQELIDYPGDLRNTINYVFQNVLICSNSQIAKRVCFDEKRLKLDCVTLSGDTYSPSGQLTGGYRQNKVSYLEKSQIYKEMYQEQQEIFNKIQKIKQKENQLRVIYEKESDIKKKRYQNGQKLNDINNKIDQLKLEQLNNQVEAIRTKIQFTEDQYNNYEQKLDNIKNLKIQYQKQMQQSKSKQSNDFFIEQLKELEDLVNKQSLEKEELEKKIKETKMFIESLQDINKETIRQINQENEKKIEQIKKQLQDEEQKRDQIQISIDEIGQEIYSFYNQLNYLQKKENDLKQSEKNLIEQLESYQQRLITCKDDKNQKKQYQKELEQNHNNRNRRRNDQIQFEIEDEGHIEETREMMAEKLQKIKKEIIQYQKEKDNLKKRTNFDIEEIYNKGNKKLQTFKEQKDETVRNKENLKESISVLTQKSFETVNRCFEEVNEHLGKIFSTFIPGMFAKMQMIDVYNKKKDIKQKGIQIKVQIANVWKQSLGELSGGQRTLLALSFLLSLLKYNSAPFYIFDEVDAALDQSNTENLGHLLQMDILQLKEQIQKIRKQEKKNQNQI